MWEIGRWLALAERFVAAHEKIAAHLDRMMELELEQDARNAAASAKILGRRVD